MTEYVVLIPAVLAWWATASRSTEYAFVAIYLPVLMLIPDYFRAPINGLPDPSFSQCAILPIGIALCWRAWHGGWKFTPMDVPVIAFVGWQFISDVYNVGYKDAQNMFFDSATLAVLPYMAGKALIEPAELRTTVARRFIWLLFIVSVVSIYEFRMGINLFRPTIAVFFPDEQTGWFTQIRWGFGRVAGPYGHAIAMGSILAMGYILCRWVSRTGGWEKNFARLGALPFSKSQVISGVLLMGMILTLSRGPWLAAAAGAILASIGVGADRRRALRHALLILVGGGLLVYGAGKAYLNSVGPGSAEEQASAQYRAILIQEYNDIAMANPIWGWGRANWPQVQGMESIDNNYLYIALGSGLVGAGLFILLIFIALWRLFIAGFLDPNLDAANRYFLFTLLGIIASVAISTLTVYMASQLFPLFFMFIGWAEACIVHEPAEVAEIEEVEPEPWKLMRVVA